MHLFASSLQRLTLGLIGYIALTPEDIEEGITPPNKRKIDEKLQSRGRTLDDSCSRQVLRDLSPLGTRQYAAPEILSGIKDVNPNIDSSCHRRLKRRNSNTKCTNNYGMIADAYSVGSTIR